MRLTPQRGPDPSHSAGWTRTPAGLWAWSHRACGCGHIGRRLRTGQRVCLQWLQPDGPTLELVFSSRAFYLGFCSRSADLPSVPSAACKDPSVLRLGSPTTARGWAWSDHTRTAASPTGPPPGVAGLSGQRVSQPAPQSGCVAPPRGAAIPHSPSDASARLQSVLHPSPLVPTCPGCHRYQGCRYCPRASSAVLCPVGSSVSLRAPVSSLCGHCPIPPTRPACRVCPLFSGLVATTQTAPHLPRGLHSRLPGRLLRVQPCSSRCSLRSVFLNPELVRPFPLIASQV